MATIPTPCARKRSTLLPPPARAASCVLVMTLLAAAGPGAQAHGHPPSTDLSAASALPVAVSIAAPSMVLAAGAQWVVLSVQATARGAVWVLERVSDGARFSVEVVGQVVVAVGTGVTVLVMGTGWLLATAADGGSQALCFVPNAVGQTLMHHEQVTR